MKNTGSFKINRKSKRCLVMMTDRKGPKVKAYRQKPGHEALNLETRLPSKEVKLEMIKE